MSLEKNTFKELVYPLPKTDDETPTGKKGSLKLLRPWTWREGGPDVQSEIEKIEEDQIEELAGFPGATDRETGSLQSLGLLAYLMEQVGNKILTGCVLERFCVQWPQRTPETKELNSSF